jgi:hypothetical protein
VLVALFLGAALGLGAYCSLGTCRGVGGPCGGAVLGAERRACCMADVDHSWTSSAVYSAILRADAQSRA